MAGTNVALTGGDLTEQERAFVLHMTEGAVGVADNPMAAAKAAGYRGVDNQELSRVVHGLLARPDIKLELAAAREGWLLGSAVAIALRSQVAICQDAAANPKEKTAAADLILRVADQRAAKIADAAPGFVAKGSLADLAHALADKAGGYKPNGRVIDAK